MQETCWHGGFESVKFGIAVYEHTSGVSLDLDVSNL